MRPRTTACPSLIVATLFAAAPLSHAGGVKPGDLVAVSGPAARGDAGVRQDEHRRAGPDAIAGRLDADAGQAGEVHDQN